MPWASVGASIGGSLVSGALGGSKAGQRAAKDAAARANYAVERATNQATSYLAPYLNNGSAASNLLAEYLGIGVPEGYAAKPTLQQFQNELRNEHFQRYGSDYNRNSNISEQNIEAERRYQEALAKWESGLDEARANAPQSAISGSLLKPFTNEDFVADPGYQFRLDQGTQGINRAASSRGGYDSGSTLKALARYNQDYASNEFQNAYNRDTQNKNNIYNYLSGTASAGQNAANSVGNYAVNAATNAGNNTMNATAQANALQQNSNAIWNNAIQSGIGNSLYAIRTAQTAPVYGDGGYTGGSSTTSGVPWYLT